MNHVNDVIDPGTCLEGQRAPFRFCHSRYVPFTKCHCTNLFHGVIRYILTDYTKCHQFIVVNSITP